MPARVPIWVRVSGITAVVLVAVVVLSMLLGSAGSAGGMGGMDHNPAQTGTVAPSSGHGGPATATPSAGPRDHIRPNH